MARNIRRAHRRLAVRTMLAAVVAAAPLAVAAPAQAADGPAIIAHRGDSKAAPENTTAAFRSAVAKGAETIEMDVRFTSSHYPVIMHDATLDRTTNCSGSVANKTRTQLAGCDAGSWFSATYRGEHVPSLDSALSTIASRSSSAVVMLHIKAVPNGDRAARIRDSVRRYGMAGRVIVIADTSSILTQMKAVGFNALGRVFSTSSGWDLRYPYLIPYNLPLSSARISAVHRRGGMVLPVEGEPYGLDYLFNVASLDGILVNHLSTALNRS